MTSPFSATGRPGRILGVDPGTVRVGLAVSDPDRLLATPHATVAGGKGVVGRIAAVCDELDCVAVVVGLPRSLGGGETASTKLARTLANDLGKAGLTVYLQDERLTSVQADRTLRAVGRSTKTTRSIKDQVAASVLLQAWLESS